MERSEKSCTEGANHAVTQIMTRSVKSLNKKGVLMEKTIKIEGMHCEHCSARVKKALSALGLECDVDFSKGEVTLTGENLDENKINDTIENLGFTVK